MGSGAQLKAWADGRCCCEFYVLFTWNVVRKRGCYGPYKYFDHTYDFDDAIFGPIRILLGAMKCDVADRRQDLCTGPRDHERSLTISEILGRKHFCSSF